MKLRRYIRSSCLRATHPSVGLKLSFATSFIYILGMIWLGSLIGWDKPIFKLGAQPFLYAELFKVLIATLAVSQIKRIRKII